MRTLLKVTIDNDLGSKAINDGTMQKFMQSTMEKIHPEAAYFVPQDGHRAMLMVFDMKEPSELVSIAEPFWMQLNAKVEFTPVMNAEDLQKGMGGLQASHA